MRTAIIAVLLTVAHGFKVQPTGVPAVSSTTEAAPTLPSFDDPFRNIDRDVIEYNDGDVILRGFIAHNLLFSVQRPAVLIVPDWNGRDEYENRRALQLAQLGYVGFAVDIYGNGTVGQSQDENRRLMLPFLQNRTLLLSRLQAALRFIQSYTLFVDNTKVAAMGYCFGGLGVLDMARAGLDMSGVVSFHGNLSPPPASFPHPAMKAKVLVLTGYEDPSVPSDMVHKFEEEMKLRKADWHLVAYGNTVHSFTIPEANIPGRAQYNRVSDKRSWTAMRSFFREIFNEEQLGETPLQNGIDAERKDSS